VFAGVVAKIVELPAWLLCLPASSA